MPQNSIRFDGITDLNNGFSIVPSGGKQIYVHSSGPSALDQLPEGMAGNPDGFFTSINAAFATCRANRGDTISCLPGHSESAATATSLSNIVAGVRVKGMCHGTADMPTVRFTATTSQWAISAAGCVFENLKLRLEGAVVAKAINVTGAGTKFRRCRIQTGSTASTNLATIAIEVGSGATEFGMEDCYVYGTGGVSTDGIKFVGATVPSNFEIRRSTFIFPATEINGLVHVTVAALDNIVEGCLFANTVTSSTAGFVVDAVASTGIISDCRFADLNNGTAAAQGAIFGAGALWRAFENYESNEAGKSGLISPAVTT